MSVLGNEIIVEGSFLEPRGAPVLSTHLELHTLEQPLLEERLELVQQNAPKVFESLERPVSPNASWELSHGHCLPYTFLDHFFVELLFFEKGRNRLAEKVNAIKKRARLADLLKMDLQPAVLSSQISVFS